MKSTALNLLIVGAGGGAGSMLRYLVSQSLSKYSASGFPIATFAVNITGCIIIGILIGLSGRTTFIDSNIRLLLVTGFCGGYTTFSTFSLEGLHLLESRQFVIFALYTFGSILIGVCGVFFGNYVVRG